MEGALVWVRDPKSQETWLKASVLSQKESEGQANETLFEVKLESNGEIRNVKTYPEDGEASTGKEALKDYASVQEYKDIKLCNTDFGEDQEEDENVSPASQVCDLVKLPHLHEPAILHVLCERFYRDRIYTYTGPILISINPFKQIEGLYSEETLEDYYSLGLLRSQGLGDDTEDLPPHVFARTDSAYRSMKDSLDQTVTAPDSLPNQSMLVSGESGAGKTETTKIIMQYLATVGREGGPSGSSHQSKYVTHDVSEDERSTRKVLSSNPILEAFGNAKTLRNENSSRFGKFIELQFNTRGCLIGAKIQTYLLEKVRLVSQTPGERGFHAFYQLLTGVADADRSSWGLIESSDGEKKDDISYLVQKFRLLKYSECFTLKDASDADIYKETMGALSTMGFGEDEKLSLWRILAGLLWLGNVCFGTCDDSDDSAYVLEDDEVECGGSKSSAFALAIKLLGLDSSLAQKALTQKRITIQNEDTYKKYTAGQADTVRDAMVKYIYGKVFDWLVKKINDNIRHDSHTSNFIGVLDIFGFEQFDHNSFEQLCINYTNEALQQHFNHFVFKVEQAEYKKEEIEWSHISFPDNQDCLDLIEGRRPPGILSLLDETCLMPQGNDENFARKCYEHLKEHGRFSVTNKQKARSQFTVNHYAGNVVYTTSSFCEKNKDTISEEAIELIKRSDQPVIQAATQISASSDTEDLPKYTEAAIRDAENKGALKKGTLSAMIGEKSGSSKPKTKKSRMMADTLGTQFRQQLKMLMTIVRATSPHYIRCLKPNSESQPRIIERDSLVSQLRCGGVLEAVRVSRAGYPVRFPHDVFLIKYRAVVFAFRQLLTEKSDCDNQISRLLSEAKYMVQNEAEYLSSCNPFSVNSASNVSDISSCFVKILRGSRRTVMKTILLQKLEERENIGKKAYGISHWASGMILHTLCNASQRIVKNNKKLAEVSDSNVDEHLETAVEENDIQVGKTKVFFRQSAYEFLENIRNSVLSGACIEIQRIVRGHLAFSYVRKYKDSIIRLQCAIRCALARSKTRELRRRKAALMVQKTLRGCACRIQYHRKRYVLVQLQSLYRGWKAREYYQQLLLNIRASQIIAFYKGRQERRRFVHRRKSAVAVQTAIRSYLAKKKLKQLREEARSLKAQQAKNEEMKSEIDRLRVRVAELENERSEEAKAADGTFISREDKDWVQQVISQLVGAIKSNFGDDEQPLETVRLQPPPEGSLFAPTFEPVKEQCQYFKEFTLPLGNSKSPTSTSTKLLSPADVEKRLSASQDRWKNHQEKQDKEVAKLQKKLLDLSRENDKLKKQLSSRWTHHNRIPEDDGEGHSNQRFSFDESMMSASSSSENKRSSSISEGDRVKGERFGFTPQTARCRRTVRRPLNRKIPFVRTDEVLKKADEEKQTEFTNEAHNSSLPPDADFSDQEQDSPASEEPKQKNLTSFMKKTFHNLFSTKTKEGQNRKGFRTSSSGSDHGETRNVQQTHGISSHGSPMLYHVNPDKNLQQAVNHSQLREEIESLRKVNQDLVERSVRTANDVNELNRENDALRSRNHDLQNQILALQKGKKEKDKIAYLEKMRKRLTQRVEELLSERREFQNTIAEQEQQLQDMNSQIKDMQRQIVKLRESETSQQ